MRTIGFSLLLILVPLTTSLAQESKGWTVRDNVPLDQFVVQAHRGAGELAEENTLEAFRLGWELNCVPEADIRMTKDGVIVPFHDANFSRVVKDAGPELSKLGVQDLSFAELRKLDVGSWKGEQFAGRQVLSLGDVFAEMQGDTKRKLYLDIKQVDLDKLATEVKKHGVESQVIFASTKYPLIREWKKLVPNSETLLWMGGTEETLDKRFQEIRNTDFADLTQLQIHTHLAMPVDEIKRATPNPFKVSDKFLTARGDEVRRHGILYQTLPWGGSTQEIYWKLLDLGFMSFATDHPKVTWDAVQAYYR